MTQTSGSKSSTKPGARRFHHVPGLDGVRAVAVLLVVGLHYGSLRRSTVTARGRARRVRRRRHVLRAERVPHHDAARGREGDRRRRRVREVLRRRALRLLPALYLVLVGFLFYTVWIGGSLRVALKEVAAVVFYVANFAQVYELPQMIESGIGMTWSLAIEEQFYLVWPALLVLGVLRFGPHSQRGAVDDHRRHRRLRAHPHRIWHGVHRVSRRLHAPRRARRWSADRCAVRVPVALGHGPDALATKPRSQRGVPRVRALSSKQRDDAFVFIGGFTLISARLGSSSSLSCSTCRRWCAAGVEAPAHDRQGVLRPVPVAGLALRIAIHGPRGPPTTASRWR